MNAPKRADSPADRVAWGRATLRGGFLACSWTWCIGMFVPVLLAADFGWPGWVVFAIPNIVGAAAMGLVLRRAGAPELVQREHRAATALFSVATLAFHAFFVSWIALEWLRAPPFAIRPDTPRALAIALIVASSPPVTALLFALLVYGIGLLSSRVRGAWWLVGAAMLWLTSLALCLASWRFTAPEFGALPPARGIQPAQAIAWTAPILALGFALCPYLDLTFLRTRRETPGRTGDAAFVLGFGGLFLVMILLTLTYTAPLLRWIVTPLVLAHMLMQSAFTIGAHLRELREHPWPGSRALRSLARSAPILAAAMPPLLDPDLANEKAYWAFMGLYGVVFPAYVWTAMVPRAYVGPLGPRARLLATLGAAALATPFAWMGFVHKAWWALGPAALIVLVTPLATGFVLRALRKH